MRTVSRLALASVLLAACGGSPKPAAEPSEPATITGSSDPGSAPHIEGKLDPAIVQRKVHDKRDEIRACYQKGIDKDPKLSGKVVVRFTIGVDGVPTDVADDGSTLPDVGVVDCVVKAFTTIRFAPLEEGKPVRVTYPIDFSKGRKLARRIVLQRNRPFPGMAATSRIRPDVPASTTPRSWIQSRAAVTA